MAAMDEKQVEAVARAIHAVAMTWAAARGIAMPDLEDLPADNREHVTGMARAAIGALEQLEVDSAVVWYADNSDEPCALLVDAMSGSDPMTTVRIWRKAGQADPVGIFAVRLLIDTNGDGEADDEEIETFDTIVDAHRFIAQLRAETGRGEKV